MMALISANRLLVPNADAATAIVDTTVEPSLLSPSRLSIAEWDVMFDAVMIRLHSCVEEGFAAKAELNCLGAPSDVGSNVLECLDALGQLRVMLDVERGRRPPS